MIALADPTFIVAAIAAVAAAASAWISWRVLRHQQDQERAPPVLNLMCNRRSAKFVELALEMQNFGAVRWRALTIDITSPAGARVITLDELGRRFPNGRFNYDQIKEMTHICRLDVEVAPAGVQSGYGSGDRHWSRVHLLLPQAGATTLSIKISLESMELRPRVRVFHIKRQLAAAASDET